LNARGAVGGRDGRRPPDPRDEYVFDASYGQTVGGPRDATYTRASGRFEGDDFTTDTNGGFMDAFEGARDGDVASPRERSARDEKTKKPSDGSLGSEFGPARFGSEADDWEL
jgi:hypothetical protein